MAKTPNPPSGPVLEAQEPVTPPPDVTLEPATPTPEIVPIDSRSVPAIAKGLPPPTGVERPSKPWSAQPAQPMVDEATVPLPMEEVEFAEAEALLSDDDALPISASGAETPGPVTSPAPTSATSANSANSANSDRQAAAPPPRPRRPSPPPARIEARPPAVARVSADAEPPAERAVAASPSARPAMPPPPKRTPRPRPTPATGAPLLATTAGGTPAPVAGAAPASVHPFLQPGATWAEALSQRPRRKRLKPWFEEAFDEDYLRTLPFMTPDQTLREVAFIKQSLRPPNDGELLDVGCGYGRHAIELGQGGYRVTGIDLSLPLLIRAADESQRRALSVNFVHADMREMAFENQFDGAYSFLTSFGYFDEEANLKVASSIYRALRPGGRFLVDTVNRDYIVSGLPTRVWWEGEGCVVLEEVDFNFQTSRLSVRRSVVFQDGRQVEHDMSIRAYSLHELGKLLRQAGFRVLEVSGGVATQGYFFGATSRSVIMLCERPTD
jgi:SAM-dependent methyltransferase